MLPPGDGGGSSNTSSSFLRRSALLRIRISFAALSLASTHCPFRSAISIGTKDIVKADSNARKGDEATVASFRRFVRCRIFGAFRTGVRFPGPYDGGVGLTEEKLTSLKIPLLYAMSLPAACSTTTTTHPATATKSTASSK